MTGVREHRFAHLPMMPLLCVRLCALQVHTTAVGVWAVEAWAATGNPGLTAAHLAATRLVQAVAQGLPQAGKAGHRLATTHDQAVHTVAEGGVAGGRRIAQRRQRLRLSDEG